MSRIAIILLLLIFIGDAYFREAFHVIWLILGMVFLSFLIIFHLVDSKKRKRKSNEESL